MSNGLAPIPDRKLSLFEPAKNFRNSGYVYRENRGKPVRNSDIWDIYSSGYLKAVNELIEAVLKGKITGDAFGYPIFHIFSHYLELRFKQIMLIGRPLIGEGTSFSQGHDLIQLWGECKRILKKIDGWNDYSPLDKEGRVIYLTIDHFVKEMAQDSKAQAFRYPVDREGNPLLDDSIVALNIENLAIVVNWLSQALDGISIGISEYRNLQDEINAEFR